jgi:hypothetical protein
MFQSADEELHRGMCLNNSVDDVFVAELVDAESLPVAESRRKVHSRLVLDFLRTIHLAFISTRHGLEVRERKQSRI